MGTRAYMRLDLLHRRFDEGDALSGAFARVDAARRDALYAALKDTPGVAGVSLKSAAMDSFQRTVGDTLAITRAITVLFAAIIAFGVVYNAARISLSERRRELATLRVVGLWRSEVSFVLLGELGLITLTALPLSCMLGYGLSAVAVRAYQTEVYRLPLVVLPRTYALAALTVLGATAISAWVVRRRVARLDLVGVLKTRG